MAHHRFYVDSKALGPSKLARGITSPSAGSAPAAHGLEWSYDGHPFVRDYADWSYYKYAPGNGIDKFGKLRAYNYSVYGENCSIELRNDYYANMNRPLNGSFSDAGNQPTPEISIFSLSYRNQGWNAANAAANDIPSLDDLLDKVITPTSQGDPWWNKYLRDGIQPSDSSFIVGPVAAIFEGDKDGEGPSYAHQTKMNYYDGTTSSNTKVVVTPTYNFYINYEAAIAEIPIGYEILLPNFYMFETEVRNPGNAYQWLLTLGDEPLFGDPATTGQSNNDWFAALTGVTPGQTAHGQYFGGYAYALGQLINNSTLSDVYDSFRFQYGSTTSYGGAGTLVVLWSDLHILQDYTIRDPQSLATTDDDIMASIFYPFYNKLEIQHTNDWHHGGRSNVGGSGYDSPFAQMATGDGGIGGQLVDYIQGYVVEKFLQNSVQSWNEDPYLKNGTPDRAVEFDSNDPNNPTAAVYQSKQEYTVHLDLENMILELMEGLTGNDLVGGGNAVSPMFQSSAGSTSTGPLLKSLDGGGPAHPNTSLVNTPGAFFGTTLLRAYDDVDASVNYLQHPHDAAAIYGQAQNNIASTLSTTIASSWQLTDGYIQRLRDMFKPNASKIRTCISETLFYVIEKHRLAPSLERPAVGAQPDQRFFISRDFTDNRKLTYYDTQVLYGERYYYEVKQLRVIWGNKYNYEVAETTTGPTPGKGRALANALGYFKDEDPNLWLNSGMASQTYWVDTYGDNLWLPDCADAEASANGLGDGDCSTPSDTENTDSNWSTTGAGVKKLDGYYIFEPTNSDWLLFYPGGYIDTNNDGNLNQAPWCTDIFDQTAADVYMYSGGPGFEGFANPIGDYPCDDMQAKAVDPGDGDSESENWSDANFQNFILHPELGYGLDGNPTGGMMGVEMYPAGPPGDSTCPPGWYDCGEINELTEVPWPDCIDCPEGSDTVMTTRVICCEECDDPKPWMPPKGCPNRLPYKDQCPMMYNTITCEGADPYNPEPDIPPGWVCCDCDVGYTVFTGDCPEPTDPDASVFEGPDCPPGWHQVGSFWNSDCIECKRDLEITGMTSCKDSTPTNAANRIMGPGVNCPVFWQHVQSHTGPDGICKECAPPLSMADPLSRADCPDVILQSQTNQLFPRPLSGNQSTPCCPPDWTLVTMHGHCCECTRTGQGGGPEGGTEFDI